MKRHVELRRSSWGITPKGPRKPLPAVNVERRKRVKSERQKARAKYRRSATYKLVKARAGGRCEYVGPNTGRRCEETEFLEHHHVRTARFGGKELPSDILVLCRTHHHYVESQQRPYNRGRLGA